MDFTSVEGEIVEIFERERKRFVRILLAPRVVCDVPTQGCDDVHLGDRVLVTGRVGIDQVTVIASSKHEV